MRMIKTRRVRRGYRWESQKERDHWEDQDVGWWIILKGNFEREDEVIWTGLIWLRIGTSEHGNEPSSPIKCWVVLE
jgi:hypothetical protein